MAVAWRLSWSLPRRPGEAHHNSYGGLHNCYDGAPGPLPRKPGEAHHNSYGGLYDCYDGPS